MNPQGPQVDLRSWRARRVEALSRTAPYRSLTKKTQATIQHMVKSRDALDGFGMCMSSKRLARELGCCDKTVRRRLDEGVAKGVLIRAYRKRLPGGEIVLSDTPASGGGRDTTPAFWLHPALEIEPGYVGNVHPEWNVHPEARSSECPPQVSTPDVHPGSMLTHAEEDSPSESHRKHSQECRAGDVVLSPPGVGVREAASPIATHASHATEPLTSTHPTEGPTDADIDAQIAREVAYQREVRQRLGRRRRPDEVVRLPWLRGRAVSAAA